MICVSFGLNISSQLYQKSIILMLCEKVYFSSTVYIEHF